MGEVFAVPLQGLVGVTSLPALASYTHASASVWEAAKLTDDPSGKPNEPKYFQAWARQMLKPLANVGVQYLASGPH